MNYYAKAIDIITNPETDFRAIVIEIAKRHPKAVFEANHEQTVSGWEREVIPLLRTEKKIHAIKVCRERTGLTLKDAKEAVETLMKEMGL